MTPQPFLLPGSRAALDPLDHLDRLGRHDTTARPAHPPSRTADAPADRAGGPMELDPRSRWLRATHAALLVRETELAKALGLEGCWS